MLLIMHMLWVGLVAHIKDNCQKHYSGDIAAKKTVLWR
jgi:hypothetical protein